MVRREDPTGEASVWCGKCSGCARCRLGRKLMNRCRPEKIDTKEHGKMFLSVLDRNARGWSVEEEKRRVTRKK